MSREEDQDDAEIPLPTKMGIKTEYFDGHEHGLVKPVPISSNVVDGQEEASSAVGERGVEGESSKQPVVHSPVNRGLAISIGCVRSSNVQLNVEAG